MAIRDFFRNLFRKQKQLPSAQVQEEKEPDSLSKLNVYAEKEGKQTKILIKINLNGTLIPIAEVTGNGDRSSLKEMNRAVTRVMDSIQIKTKTEDELEFKKKKAKSELEELGRVYGFTLLPELDNVLNCYLPNQEIDYSKLNKILPKTIDISKMSQNQVLNFGKILDERLKLLETLKTPEDVKGKKKGIISFMKSQETEDPLGAVVAANLESVNSKGKETLDLSTLLACAKCLKTLDNEDAIMYSVYLKLEEKRILKKVQEEIEATRTEDNGERIDSLLSEVEKMKMGITLGQTLEQKDLTIVEYMMAIRYDRDIERYANTIAKKDMDVRRYVLDNKTPNAIAISEYFSSRIASLGQVTQIREQRAIGKVVPLRRIIEETSFKDPDERESDEFLLQVGQLEKDYIRNNYSELLERYYMLTKQAEQKRENNGLDRSDGREGK